jgi:hypothetical protein
MKFLVKILYLIVFACFAITSKPLRITRIYQQERFLQVAKEVGAKISSERAIWLTGKINNKIKELESFMSSRESIGPSHEKSLLLKEEVNELIGKLVAENTSNYIYRCFVWFT